MPGASLGTGRSRVIPVKALLDRLGSGANSLSWSSYLPDELQPPELRAARLKTASNFCSSSAMSHWGEEIEEVSSEDLQGSPLDDLQLEGRVWSLSKEAHGCRQVQTALDSAPSDAAREALALELRGHVLEACKCPHANHVLQKIILLLPASSLQFIVDELMAGAIAPMVRHKYGCRIIQRLVEHCCASQVHKLVEIALKDIPTLGRHPYGTYVIQNILQHGTHEHRRRIVAAVIKGIGVLGAESNGCAVVSAALSYGLDRDRYALAQVVLREHGLLCFMANSRHGHTAAMRVLDLLGGDDQVVARARLQAQAASLRLSRYGRIVVEYMEAGNSDQSFLSAASRAGA